MRRLLLAVAVLAGLAQPDAARSQVVSVRVDGPVEVGRTVQVHVTARGNGVRLTFPDLQGDVASLGCGLAERAGVRRFSLPYRPAWPGTHVLSVSATAGGCGAPAWTGWPVAIEVGPRGAAAGAARVARACAGADDVPLPRRMRAARLSLVCLVNAERVRRGLRPLVADAALRRAASRRAHRPAARGRPGQHVLAATAEHATPARAVQAWLGGDPHRRDLLDRRVRRVGAAVVAGPRGQLGRLGATWAIAVR